MTDHAALILDRFCGRETYPVKKATWNLYLDDELGLMNLCLWVEAGQGSILHEDTKDLHAEPSWEVNLLTAELVAAPLVVGSTFIVPYGYEEAHGGYVTNFYYCEHESTESNMIEVLAAEEERLLLRLTGETVDVNFYDGSKPPTKLSVETWFLRDTRMMRSMS
jgi:hypothetical protein